MVEKAKSARDQLADGAHHRGSAMIWWSLTNTDIGATIERLNRLITDLLALSGRRTSMTHTHGWRFAPRRRMNAPINC